MRNWMNNAVLGTVGALALAAGTASAADTVVLKDGTRVEGEIVKEIAGSVWIVEANGVGDERFITSFQITEIIYDDDSGDSGDAGDSSDASGAVNAAAAGDGDGDASRAAAIPDGARRGTVITLEGTVGIEFLAEQLERLIPQIEEEVGTDRRGVVVLKINSGGGMLIEVDRLHKVLRDEYMNRFDAYVWIESAISAAAMTSHIFPSEKIIFMPEGNYGGATAWFGNLTSVKGREFLEIVYQMEQISDEAGHDRDIVLAMQGDPSKEVPLSVYWDDAKREWNWVGAVPEDVTEGDAVLINPPGEVLTFNSVVATQYDFCRGIARNTDELTDLLELGEIHWVGEDVRGLVHPVGPAERENRRWRELVGEENGRMQSALSKMQISMSAAEGAGEQQVRGALVNRARKSLREVRRLVGQNMNLALSELNVLDEEEFNDWYAEIDERLRDLARPR